MDSSERLIDEQLIERLNVLSVGISMIDMENALALMEHPNIARVLDAGEAARLRLRLYRAYGDGMPVQPRAARHGQLRRPGDA